MKINVSAFVYKNKNVKQLIPDNSNFMSYLPFKFKKKAQTFI